MIRHVPGYLATLVAAVLVFVFIAYPLGSVLLESFAVSRPMSVFELRELTRDALDRMDPTDREKTVRRWVATAKPKARMAAIAAALKLIGEEVPWDRKAPFDDQIADAEAAVAALGPDKRARFEEQMPISIVMLHKRIPLAFKIKKRLSQGSSTACARAPTRALGSNTTSPYSRSRGCKKQPGTVFSCRSSLA